MFVEEREYKIVTGKLQEFWGIYRSKGLPLQIKYIGPPIGFFSVEVGEITNFVHMWLYESLSDREHRRHKLHEDAQWQQYVLSTHPYIQSMNIRVLKVLDVPETVGAMLMGKSRDTKSTMSR